MQNFIFLGTDVSKLTLDHGIHTVMVHQKTANNSEGFKTWLKWALQFGPKEQFWVVMGTYRVLFLPVRTFFASASHTL
jgi:hypothetical protein